MGTKTDEKIKIKYIQIVHFKGMEMDRNSNKCSIAMPQLIKRNCQETYKGNKIE